jgi:Leucine-rich repeat (LRR) protein
MKASRYLALGLLVSVAACGTSGAAPSNNVVVNVDRLTVLEPGDLCSRYSDQTRFIATFEDPRLEHRIRFRVSVGPDQPLRCDAVSAITTLSGGGSGIASLVGLQNLRSLTFLDLGSNAITDLGPLTALTELTRLGLGGNPNLVDLAPLSGLTSLRDLDLESNASLEDIGPLSSLINLRSLGLGNVPNLADIAPLASLTNLATLYLTRNPNVREIGPLIDNPGVGAGDMILLGSTPVSCTDVTALRAKGAIVSSEECP